MLSIGMDATDKPVVRIIVIGVGGAGNNAIGRMIEEGISNVELLGINTDKQALQGSKAPRTIQIGEKTTGGRGAGAKPEVGEKSAIESEEEIAEAVKGADMIFVTCGMGGGTGTGAAPVVARIAKEQGILTVGVVTKPFKFEAKRRMDNALNGIARLRESVDALVVIPNEKLIEVSAKTDNVLNAFKLADQTLHKAVVSITDLILKNALINLDFADVETVMKDKGLTHIGVGIATGENRAIEAVKAAVENPLLETSIVGASDVLVNVSGSNVNMNDYVMVNQYIVDLTGEDVNIISGLSEERGDDESITVSIIATGLEEPGTSIRNAATPSTLFNSNIGGPAVGVSGVGSIPRPAAPVQTPLSYTQPLYTQPSYATPASPVTPGVSAPHTSAADLLNQAAPSVSAVPTPPTLNIQSSLSGLNASQLDTTKGEINVNIPDFLSKRK